MLTPEEQTQEMIQQGQEAILAVARVRGSMVVLEQLVEERSSSRDFIDSTLATGVNLALDIVKAALDGSLDDLRDKYRSESKPEGSEDKPG